MSSTSTSASVANKTGKGGKAIPILITGKGEQIGKMVVAGMAPEYEVIHFTMAANITRELPLLLKGKIPSDEERSSKLGSGNWSTFPKALLLGGAYEDDDIAQLKDLIAKEPDAKRIPWLRVDSSKPHPPLGPEYGKAIVQRAKDALAALAETGKLDEETDEVVFF